MTLLAILVAALAESVVSFSGGLLALRSDVFARHFAHRALGFAIGALLAVSFLELIPEAAETLGSSTSYYVLVGILIFFITEKLLRWYHHHEGHEDEYRPYGALILAGDAIHNFIDGVALAIAFLVSIPLGIATTVAVLLHEIPQEIADFSVLVRSGYGIRRTLWANFFVSLTTIVGALLGFGLSPFFTPWFPHLLAVIAGSFLYIALSDLIPETHEQSGIRHLAAQLCFMIAGIVLISIFRE